MITLTPAYGRDYKTAKQARAAWAAGLDWILNDPASRFNGKPISIRDLPPGTGVRLRYLQGWGSTVIPATTTKE